MHMKRSVKSNILLGFKGILMGAAEAVPGVSGGTIAFVTGIYEELILSITKIRWSLLDILQKQGIKAVWKEVNGSFFLALLSGMSVSFVIVLKTAKWLLLHHPILIWSFFFGLICGSTFLVGRAMKIWNTTSIVTLIFGALLAFVLTNLPAGNQNMPDWFLFVAGAIAICAMILPGISGAYLLVLMGVYDDLGQAVEDVDLKKIVLFGAGVVFGLLSFSRLLKWLFAHFRNFILALLTGFIFGSLYKIWPWKTPDPDSGWITDRAVWPSSYPSEAHGVEALFLMIVGLGIIVALDSLQKENQ
jgi:putative membrane protein